MRSNNAPKFVLNKFLIVAFVVMLEVLAQAHEQQRHQTPQGVARNKALSMGQLNIPDVQLTDHRGESVRFYCDLVKDKAVAINFVYTTCTTVCPPMGAYFSAVQSLMGDRIGRDLGLISVSIDPVIDTPERLRAWGKKFQAGLGWSLLTGSKHEVDRLLKALKVFTADKVDHAPIVLVGNEPARTWTRVNGLASPTTLARLITEVGSVPPLPESKASRCQ
jgi:protein SCO1